MFGDTTNTVWKVGIQIIPFLLVGHLLGERSGPVATLDEQLSASQLVL